MPSQSFQRAQALIAAGQLDQAAATLTRALARDGGDADGHALLCWTLMQLGQLDRARFYAERACALRPGQADPLFNLGKLLLIQGDSERAVECFERAVAAEPGNAATFAALTNALNMARRYADAEERCSAGLTRWPDHPELLMDLAAAAQSSGRSREAYAILRRAAAAHPDNLPVAALLCSVSNYAGDADPRDAFEAHRAFGRLVARAYPGPHSPPARPRDPERPLNVGIVSSDLRNHAMRFFISALLRHHDRDSLRVTCYSTSGREDETSKQMRGWVAAWRSVHHLPVPALAAQIRADGMDILIDLAGHTTGHRMEVFHLRPAPVSVTYFGYIATTGVPGMDYRLVDSLSDPPEPWYDDLATEKLWRLDPCHFAYSGPPGAPLPSPPPSQNGAPFTFGSFNNLAKHDDIALALYRRCLEAVPGSRMLLKYAGLETESGRSLLLRRFAGAGIAAERLVLEPPGKDTASTIPSYAKMDLMLDAFPFHGVTTSLEALFMGVPVVTLAGRTSASRTGVSILTNVGLPELIAQREDDYVRIAAALAGDPTRLASLRAGLRDRMLASPACDGPGFARRCGAAFREMWRRWCAGPNP